MSLSLLSNFSSMGYQQNRSSSISTFHDYNQQNNEYDDGDEDSGWKGFGNDDKSNSREDMGLKFSHAWHGCFCRKRWLPTGFFRRIGVIRYLYAGLKTQV